MLKNSPLCATAVVLPSKTAWYKNCVRPLSDLDASGIEVVAFDVDDTVTDGRHFCPRAYSAMHDLVDAGLVLIAATGRSLGLAETLAHYFPMAFAVGENGAGWVSVGESGVTRGFFLSEVERCTIDDQMQALRDVVSQALPQVREADDQWLRRCDLAFDINEYRAASAEEITRLKTLIEAAGARFIRSSIHAHAIFGEWDKAKGIEAGYTHICGGTLAKAATLYIGDSPNDAAAFGAFNKNSVGVSNVTEHTMSTLPRYVTPSARGRGFAELAAHVLRGR